MTEHKKEKTDKRKPKEKGDQAESGRVKIGVSIDEMLWRRIRALAILEDKGTGELLDKAIEDFLKDKEKV